MEKPEYKEYWYDSIYLKEKDFNNLIKELKKTKINFNLNNNGELLEISASEKQLKKLNKICLKFYPHFSPYTREKRDIAGDDDPDQDLVPKCAALIEIILHNKKTIYLSKNEWSFFKKEFKSLSKKMNVEQTPSQISLSFSLDLDTQVGEAVQAMLKHKKKKRKPLTGGPYWIISFANNEQIGGTCCISSETKKEAKKIFTKNIDKMIAKEGIPYFKAGKTEIEEALSIKKWEKEYDSLLEKKYFPKKGKIIIFDIGT